MNVNALCRFIHVYMPVALRLTVCVLSVYFHSFELLDFTRAKHVQHTHTHMQLNEIVFCHCPMMSGHHLHVSRAVNEANAIDKIICLMVIVFKRLTHSQTHTSGTQQARTRANA